MPGLMQSGEGTGVRGFNTSWVPVPEHLWRPAFCALMIAVCAMCGAALGADRDPVVPQPLIRVSPDYPINAWNKEISGRVEARVTVDEDGRVTDVAIASENPLGWGFGTRTREALERWVYPADRAGTYPAKLKFEWKQVELTDAEKRLPKARPPVFTVAPEYPAKAQSRSASGEAIVVLMHDKSGMVTNVRIASENPAGLGFGEAMSNAIRQWRFAPGTEGVKSLLMRFSIRL